MNDQERKAARNKAWRTNIEAVLATALLIAGLSFLFWLDRKMFPLS